MGRLIIAVMYPSDGLYSKCRAVLVERFGSLLKESEPYDFDKFTSYYEKEMGKGILKRFLVFSKEISKQDLVKVKKETTLVEKDFSKEGNRQINLDPGYVSSKELVLASFKKGTNYKEDLGQGVYAHKVLEFNPVKMFWHTFPDYREKWEFFIEN